MSGGISESDFGEVNRGFRWDGGCHSGEHRSSFTL